MRFLTLLLPATALAAQLPLFAQRPSANTANLLSPESSASHIASDAFTTLSHADFGDHSLRVKETTGWCDESVKSWTGYLDSHKTAKHYFFYFFESRGNPRKDDLMLWTNGGPGCSSSMGLLMELGPCNVQPDGNSTKVNPYAWNEKANMIFIDQPVGVGFSYSDHGIHVDTTEQAAVDLHAFLVLFYEAFPHLAENAFHLSGESYGGRYLPVFATEIVHQNAKLLKHSNKDKAKAKAKARKPINLRSVLIGNGLTDTVSMVTSYYDQACTAASGLGRPVLDVKECIQMQQSVKKCDKWLAKVCRDSVVQPECEIALEYCNTEFEERFIAGEINPYDISKPCTTLNEDLCYPETKAIGTYLDQPWVRAKLGAAKQLGPFQSCSNKVGTNFALSRDALAPTFFHLTGLLENGVRVLVYVGAYDWICNFIGNRRMVEALEWSGAEAFRGAEMKDFYVGDGEAPAGQAKTHGLLTYVQIAGAGHMVPLDKPAESLYVTERWLAGEPIVAKEHWKVGGK